VSAETEKLAQSLGEYKTKIAPEMKVRLAWEKDLIFAVRTSTGYVFDFDAQVEWGCMPTESMLASIGACLAIDVVSHRFQDGHDGEAQSLSAPVFQGS
jgi:hypothetical protein